MIRGRANGYMDLIMSSIFARQRLMDTRRR